MGHPSSSGAIIPDSPSPRGTGALRIKQVDEITPTFHWEWEFIEMWVWWPLAEKWNPFLSSKLVKFGMWSSFNIPCTLFRRGWWWWFLSAATAPPFEALREGDSDRRDECVGGGFFWGRLTQKGEIFVSKSSRCPERRSRCQFAVVVWLVGWRKRVLLPRQADK